MSYLKVQVLVYAYGVQWGPKSHTSFTLFHTVLQLGYKSELDASRATDSKDLEIRLRMRNYPLVMSIRHIRTKLWTR